MLKEFNSIETNPSKNNFQTHPIPFFFVFLQSLFYFKPGLMIIIYF